MLKKVSVGKNITYQAILYFQNVRAYFSRIINISESILVDLV